MATVLIIDDRHINREYLSSILKYLNHESKLATNGKEGLDLIFEQCPDLIITDILMPQMNGYEFASYLKQHEKYKDIPIIFYTADYRKEEADLRAVEMGVFAVLAKPADPQSIIQVVERALKENDLKLSNVQKRQSKKNLKINLYRASHELFNIAGRLHSTNELIQNIKQALNQDTDNSKQHSILEMINQISDDLAAYRKVNSDLFSLIELTFEMIDEKNAKKLLQLYCDGARKAVNATSAVAVILPSSNEIGFQVASGPVIEDPRMSAVVYQARSAMIQNGMLIAPIVTVNKLYGIAYFVQPKMDNQFTNDDIRMLDTLTTELSIFYENITLFEIIKDKSARLEEESAKLKIAKEEIEKSEIMFRQFAENIKDVFWRKSSSLDELIYISPGYEEIWGKPTETMYQNPNSWLDSVIDIDKPKVIAFVKQIKKKQTNDAIEYRIKRVDGRIRNIYNKTICLKNEQGVLQHYIGIASDITDYLENQKLIGLDHALSQLLEKETLLAQSIPQILHMLCEAFEWDIGEFWVVDERKQILQQKHTWSKGSQYSELESLSKNLDIKINEDLIGQSWESGEILWSDHYSQIAHPNRMGVVQLFHFENAISIPLIHRDNVLAVMNFLSKFIASPSENLIRILSVLAARIVEYIHQKMTQEQLVSLAKRGANRVIF